MYLSRFSLAFVLLFLAAFSAGAANLNEIKAQMKERQPKIEALWASGKIGENNRGFVEARADLSEAEQQLIAAENADREQVYDAIARSTQTTPKQVGLQRALQISKRAAKGLWLQDADGDWYKKE